MDAIDRLGLLANLQKEFCELNHGFNSHREEHPAVDYIIQPFGYNVNKIEEVSMREMLIPVCAECAEALQGNKWTLLYCFECCSSQWIYREFAKNHYRHHILWLKGCPECTSKFGGLFFSDLEAIVKTANFTEKNLHESRKKEEL